MRRDWELMKKLLLDIQAERYLLADISDKSLCENEVERTKMKGLRGKLC